MKARGDNCRVSREQIVALHRGQRLRLNGLVCLDFRLSVFKGAEPTRRFVSDCVEEKILFSWAGTLNPIRERLSSEANKHTTKTP